MVSKAIDFMKEKHIFYLIAGFFFSIFSIGRFNIAISVFIWPFCFLSYLHKSESKILPSVIVSVCLFASHLLRWINVLNAGFILNLIWSSYSSIINIIPFIIDNIFYGKVDKWKSVFIYPLTEAFIEFVFCFFPVANSNLLCYALREHIEFIQIISCFGCYFLSFIIALFSTILEYSIDLYRNENKISKFIFSYAAIILVIYFFGLIRMLIPLEVETINVASSIGVSQPLYEIDETDSYREQDVYLEYINKTMKRASQSEAQIMAYAEEAFAIIYDEREGMLGNVSELAKLYSIYVLLALDVCHNETYCTNEAVLISDKGDILYEYQKQHLIPFTESIYYENMEKTYTVNTSFGNVGVVICYDINYPNYLNSLSREHFDLLLVPSWDWDSIAEWHSNEAKYRAIEGGFNLVKITAHGYVISCDTRGRTLSYVRNEGKDYNVINTVNNKGVKTLYSYIGIFFNYLYLIALVAIILSDIIMKLGKKNNHNDGTVGSDNYTELKLNSMPQNDGNEE